MTAVKAFKACACAEHPSTVKFVGVFQPGVLSKIRDCDTSEDVIH